jgi:intergrase/recombinase
VIYQDVGGKFEDDARESGRCKRSEIKFCYESLKFERSFTRKFACFSSKLLLF